MKARFIMLTIILFACCPRAFAETYEFVGSDFPYIAEYDDEGNITGAGVDIVREVMKQAGHEVRIVLYPWKRALAMVRSGKAHAVISVYKTDEREEFLDYGKYHFYEDEIFFYTGKESDFKWNGNFSSLEEHTIALMAGWSYGKYADENLKELKTFPFYTTYKCLELVMMGRYDLCLLNHRDAYYTIMNNGLEGRVVKLLPPVSRRKIFFAFSRKRKLDKLRQQFDLEMEKLVKSGEITRILERNNLKPLISQQGP